MTPGREVEGVSAKTTMLKIFHETARGWYPTHDDFLVALETRVYQAIQANQVTLKDYVRFKVEEALRLQEMAAKDFLTELWARAGFEERYREAFEQSQFLTVVNLDIDNFGEVNNAIDHETGDEVLKIFAKLLKAATRESGFAARMGGDEFVLVLPETPADSAQITAQEIIEKFSQQLKGLDERILALNITVSAGVYTSQPEDDKLTILRRADHAEGAAKRDTKRSAKKDVAGRVYLWRPEFD